MTTTKVLVRAEVGKTLSNKNEIDLSQRKLIVAMTEAEREQCEYDPEGRDLLNNPEVLVQQYPVQRRDETLLELQHSGQLRPGVMLVQSPFDDNVYEDIADAEDSFAVRKYTLFSTVCMLLGAKEVRVERITLKDEKGEVDLSAGGDRMGGTGNVGVSYERAESLRAKLSLVDKFVGGDADVVAAERIMRRAGLMRDPNLFSLLEMARVDSNRIRSRTLTINLSSEANKRMELAAAVGVPKIFSGNVAMELENYKKTEYKVIVEVKF